jgi:hypothetical protein
MYWLSTGFEPEYSKAEIKQDIGGVLICNTVFNADHHTWQYDVNYKYKAPNDSIYDIGDGRYDGREWNKNEQLIKNKNWVLLKTGLWRGSDKLIIRDLKTGKSRTYEFSPENIEKEALWISSNTSSLLGFCCSESYITKIDTRYVYVLYKFRIDENQTDMYGQRKLIYQFDSEQGKLKLIKVVNFSITE